MRKKNSRTFELLILGSSSAMPSADRFPSAQILNIQEALFLIDCGEATQNRLFEHRTHWNRITYILISHMHGDHVFGLPGLITTFCHLGRQEPLILVGPEGLEEFLNASIQYSHSHLTFEIKYIKVNHLNSECIFDDGELVIQTIPLYHRVPTIGYLFKVNMITRKLNLDKMESLSIPVHEFKKITQGEDIEDNEGTVYHAEDLSTVESWHCSYAYCSDTKYNEAIIPLIDQVDVLYHETTYLNELADKAEATGHATAYQAATLALKARVGALVTGHYSSRYKSLYPLLEECKSIFENTILGREGLKIDIAELKKTSKLKT